MVLCAYLGQLVKLRKALSTEVTTLIDERDAIQLVNYEEQEDVGAILAEDVAQEVKVSARVYVRQFILRLFCSGCVQYSLLRTVDNFQGTRNTSFTRTVKH